MTTITLYHVDAFTNKLFSGNPAAVCLLPIWLAEDKLVAIAKENNLPVTAFLVRDGEQYQIRWITPDYELALCGHGTLAAGFVIFNYLDPGKNSVVLQSPHEKLEVLSRDGLVTINFPAKPFEPCIVPLLAEGLGATPREVFQHKEDRCIAIFDHEEQIINLTPDMQILKNVPHVGITVTAQGNQVDFVSRTFYPKKVISEDPVTGASHCLLAPYWSKRLNKMDLAARQVSARGGEIFCQHRGDRVLISGHAILYMQGEVKCR